MSNETRRASQTTAIALPKSIALFAVSIVMLSFAACHTEAVADRVEARSYYPLLVGTCGGTLRQILFDKSVFGGKPISNAVRKFSVSPDRRSLAFIEQVDLSSNANRLVIFDLESRTSRTLVTTPNSEHMVSFEWLDNHAIAYGVVDLRQARAPGQPNGNRQETIRF